MKRLDLVCVVDDTLAVEESSGKLNVVSRGPHRNDQGTTVEPDLERLLHGDVIRLDAVATAADTDRADASW